MNSLLAQGVQIELLGGLQVRQGDRLVSRFTTYKIGALLAFLAYFPERPHPRETLIELLWPEGTPERGRNNLSTALSSLRHLLEPPGVPAGAVIQAERFTVRLNPIAFTTDVADFEAALQRAERAPGESEQAEHLADAVDRYRGPLLPGYYEEWVLTEQVRLEERFFQTIDTLIAHCERDGDIESALRFARRALRADPLREEAHRAAMRLYLASGRREQALRQFRELETVLERHEAGAPSAETMRLWQQIQQSRSDPAAPLLPAAPQTAVAGSPASDRALDAPTGTVTFLFTDIEGSTAQWESVGRAYQAALSLHHALLRQEFRRLEGFEANEGGDGFVVAFARPTDALACAAAAQKALAIQPWPEQVGSVRVRMALHTGEVEREAGAYRGLTLHRGARLLGAAHGGQILCSEATAALVRRDLEPGCRLTDLGVYRLRDVDLPERIYEVEVAGMALREFPPLRAEPHHTGHLPVSLTRFFGREVELARLKDLLGDVGIRLVTLTGMGGTGKTRLALEAARQAEGAFSGAVWFAALAEVREITPLVTALANTLRLTLTPHPEPLEQVIRALSSQASLLVLDNFEQLAEAGSAVVQTLLDRVPALKLLLTSRQRLNLAGERELEVPPLATPHGAAGPERLSLYDSVRLFVDRAQGVKPDFRITDYNAPAVAELCDRLEGIPLAIELAAARAQVLTPLQMLAQLQNRFDFLVNRQRGAEERHRTLRATLEWSDRLLPEELQRFFARLSVFRGGWSLEAAEVVCNEPLALDYLAQLREASLVAADDQESVMRFRLLETVREYAWEKLQASGEINAVRSRHRDWFLTLAEEAEPQLKGPDQAQWLLQLEMEHDNLRAALAWCEVDVEGAEAGLRMAGALWQFWNIRGHLSEGRQWLSAVLSRAAVPDHRNARADALNGAGRLAWMQGDYTAARALHEESLAICRELGDKSGLAASLTGLVYVVVEQGDYAAARALQGESLAICRELGDKPGVALSLVGLGYVAWLRGDYAAARTLHEESLAICRELGDKSGLALSLWGLGNVAKDQGEYAMARTLHGESMAIYRELGNRWGIALSLMGLGLVAYEQGDYAAARTPQGESLVIFQELGDKRGIAYARWGLGNVTKDQGDYAAARTLQGQSLAIYRELGDNWGIAHTLWGLGLVAYEQGDYAAALTLYGESLVILRTLEDKRGIADALDTYASFAHQEQQVRRAVKLRGAATALREAIGAPIPPNKRRTYDQQVAQAHAALGEEAFDAVFEEGRAMAMELAVEYAEQQNA
jgi:predicted ATPase/DNA-binding SARP family transcriptional activator